MKKWICVLMIAICLFGVNIPFSYAASSPPVVSFISPSTEVVYTKDLLISLRVLEPKTLKLRVYKIVGQERELIEDPLTIETNSKLNFYTKQIPDIKPGNYEIIVEDINNTSKTYKCKVEIKEKQTTTPSAIFNSSEKSGTLQLVQNVIKNIFGGSDK